MAKKETKKINGAAAAEQRVSAGALRAEKYKAIKIEPEFTDFEDIYAMFVERAKNGAKAVEVGSWIGKSALMLLELIEASGKAIDLTLVDPFDMDAFQKPNGAYSFQKTGAEPGQLSTKNLLESNLAEYEGKYSVLEAFSPEAADAFEEESLDFVFIDGNHEKEAVLADLNAWWPKLKPGAMFAGHDHSWDYPFGVPEAVWRFCYENGLAYGVSGKSWYCFKPKADGSNG